MTVSMAPSGLAFGRYIKAIGVAKGDILAALAFAEGQRWEWGSTPEVFTSLKAAVTAMSTGDPGGLGAAVASPFLLPLLRTATLVDRLPLRRVPLNIAVPVFSGDASAYVVPEGQPKPLSVFSLDTLTVTPRKIAAAIVVTDELLRFSDPAAEAALSAELTKAVIARMDIVFADPNLGGSIANGAIVLSSSGGTIAALDADIRRMLEALAPGGHASAVWIMSTYMAIWMATLRSTNNGLAYPTVTAKGGTLAGLPVLVSSALTASGSPTESSLLLVATDQVLFGDSGDAEVSVAKSASVQMVDDPASGATSTVSLFQANRVGILCERYCGWSRVADNSVVVLDEIQFAA